jgi:hypothetical protein
LLWQGIAKPDWLFRVKVQVSAMNYAENLDIPRICCLLPAFVNHNSHNGDVSFSIYTHQATNFNSYPTRSFTSRLMEARPHRMVLGSRRDTHFPTQTHTHGDGCSACCGPEKLVAFYFQTLGPAWPRERTAKIPHSPD